MSVIAINGFNGFVTGTATTSLNVVNLLQYISKVCFPVDVKNPPVINYYSGGAYSVSTSESGGSLVGVVLGSSISGFMLTVPLIDWLKQQGDTVTAGSRVSFNTAFNNLAPVLGGVTTNTPYTLEYPAAAWTSPNSNTPYVEIEVKKLETGYTMSVWVEGVLTTTTSIDVLPETAKLVIGTNHAWKAIPSSTTISLSDQYIAYNRDGITERIGSCTVARIPREVISGNTDADTVRMSMSGNASPFAVQLTEPCIMRIPTTTTFPTGRVPKYVKTVNTGVSTQSGLPAKVTTQVKSASSGSVIRSNTKENVLPTYPDGVVGLIMPVTSFEEMKDHLYIASGNDEPIV